MDTYLLSDHWCFHIYSYHAILEINGQPCSIFPGCASIIPPGTQMRYRYRGPSEHVYFHFRPAHGSPNADVAMIVDLGDHYSEMDRRARQSVIGSGIRSEFPTATLWSLLWEVVDLDRTHGRNRDLYGHPTVTAAINHIEQRLSKSLRVGQLCDEVGVSYGYLSRLFSRYLGVSVLEYVRSRRADRAEHLIRSTTLPIKTIAAYVGVPDLRQFNRLMHQTKGASPRAIRARWDVS